MQRRARAVAAAPPACACASARTPSTTTERASATPAFSAMPQRHGDDPVRVRRAATISASPAALPTAYPSAAVT